MNYKKYITAVAAIVVLVALFFGANFLKQKYSKPADGQQAKGPVYENKQFGYRIVLPSNWTDYRVLIDGQRTSFLYPTTNTGFINAGDGYAPVFDITAIPKTEVDANYAHCHPKPEDAFWGDCVAFTDRIGENNNYVFVGIRIDHLTDYPDDFKTDLFAAMEQSAKDIQTYNVQKATTLYFIDPNRKISWSYPADLFKFAGESVYLPMLNDENAFLGLYSEYKHEINVEHCALSGSCEPTTRDMVWGIGDLNYTLAQLQKSPIGAALEKQTYGTNTFYTYEEGAEGEGRVYYFMVKPNGKLLVMFRSYINENVVTNYQRAKDFLPYAKQAQIANQILTSIKLEQ